MATAILEEYNNLLSGGDPSIQDMFLLKSIKPMLTIVSSYILFVTYVGPAIMKNRKPLDLRKFMIVYNFSLVLYYIYFLLKGTYFIYQLGFSFICDSTLDSKANPLVADFFHHGYWLYIVRNIELIDTVFLVLLKKFRMITPLHVFHHSIVPVFGWVGFRLEKSTYMSVILGFNSIVHVVMYSYYAIAALGPEYQKYLWWKKYLTSLQITQFFCLTVYLSGMYAVGCVTSKATVVFCAFLTTVFFIWFTVFFRQTYIQSEKNKASQNGSSHQNKNGSSAKTE